MFFLSLRTPILWVIIAMDSELMEEPTELSYLSTMRSKEETQREQTHMGFIYNAGPVGFLDEVCQLGLGVHRVLPLLPDEAVLREAVVLLVHGLQIKLSR